MAPEKVLKITFFGLMGAIVAALFYQIFFQITIDGQDGGILVYLARQAEVPMAQYYYTYSYVPNTVSTQGLDEALDFTTKVDGADFTKSENIKLNSNITDMISYSGIKDTDDVFVNEPSSHSGIYSSGWSKPKRGF